MTSELRYKRSRALREPIAEQIDVIASPWPNRLWNVPIATITLRASSRDIFKCRPRLIFHVAPGDWDITGVAPRVPIHEEAPEGAPRKLAHDTVRSLVFRGADYRDTPAYAELIDQVRSGQLVRGRSTEAAVDAYLREQAEMIDSMKRHGYLVQRQLGVEAGDE